MTEKQTAALLAEQKTAEIATAQVVNEFLTTCNNIIRNYKRGFITWDEAKRETWNKSERATKELRKAALTRTGRIKIHSISELVRLELLIECGTMEALTTLGYGSLL